jgi:hypothetical protein
LLALFATGPLPTAAAISGRAAGTLSRPRMLAAAAPTTSKQVSAINATALVKRFSVRSTNQGHLPDKSGINYGFTVPLLRFP